MSRLRAGLPKWSPSNGSPSNGTASNGTASNGTAPGLRVPLSFQAGLATILLSLTSSAAAQDLWAAPDGNAANTPAATPAVQPTPSAQAPSAQAPSAQAPGSPSAGTAETGAPRLRDPHDGYFVTLTDGRNAIVRRDFDVAIATLRQAASKTPNRPEAYCHTGDAFSLRAQRTGQSDDLKEALESYRACARFARGGGHDFVVAMAMAGEAQTLELLEGKGGEARRAWAMTLNGTQNTAARGLAQARVSALDSVEQLNRNYELVRTRIAERERIAAEPAKPKKKKKRRAR